MCSVKYGTATLLRGSFSFIGDYLGGYLMDRKVMGKVTGLLGIVFIIIACIYG